MSPTTFIFFFFWIYSALLLIFQFQVIATQSPADIHDLLPQYGFPKGLIPNNVASYTISSSSGFFTIHLQSPCYVLFSDQLVYYHTLITGTLTYGSVSTVKGIQAKELFLWLPVTGINVDRDSGILEFFVGALSKKLPADQFQRVPGCSHKACKGSTVTKLVDLM